MLSPCVVLCRGDQLHETKEGKDKWKLDSVCTCEEEECVFICALCVLFVRVCVCVCVYVCV